MKNVLSIIIIILSVAFTQAFAQSESTTTAAVTQSFSQLKVSPASLSFSKLNLTKGPATAEKSFVVKNTGTVDLSVTVGNPASADLVITVGAGAATLGAKQSHTVTVKFAPTQDGSFSDSILITSNATKGSTNATVNMKGSAQKQFTALSAKMISNRVFHTATLLPNGSVLVAGGAKLTNNDAIDTAEIFDPVAETFTPITATMTVPRSGHKATLLLDGMVLITGGGSDVGRADTAELYDPIAQTFTVISATMTTPRSGHTATRLQDGKVLIAGGHATDNAKDPAMNTAELYDPVAQTFSPIAAAMATPRTVHAAVLLSNSLVLLTGGLNGNGVTPGPTFASAELYDPVAKTFTSAVGTMTSPRAAHTSALLPDGRVLLTGGAAQAGNSYTAHKTAELFDPVAMTSTSLTAKMTTARLGHTATALSNGLVVLIGGAKSVSKNDSPGPTLKTAEVY